MLNSLAPTKAECDLEPSSLNFSPRSSPGEHKLLLFKKKKNYPLQIASFTFINMSQWWEGANNTESCNQRDQACGKLVKLRGDKSVSHSPDDLESTAFFQHTLSSLPNSNNLHSLNTESGSDHVLKPSCGLTQLILTPTPWGESWDLNPEVWFQNPSSHESRNIFLYSRVTVTALDRSIYLTLWWAFIYFSVSLNHNCKMPWVFIIPSSFSL